MEKIIEILKNVRDDIDYAGEKKLVDDKLLDSFDVVGIVSELTMEYGVTITIDDITPENFNSVEAIHAMIERLLEE
jgi:acyl carrier protein